MTPKEMFSHPNSSTIVNGRCRTRPTTCPICRETFYNYEKADEYNSRTSDEPIFHNMNKPDHIGYITPRQTCGAWECYVAEERYAHRCSPFFNERLRDHKEEEIERPKNIKQIGLNYDIF